MPVPLKHAITNTLVQNKKLKQVYTMTELSALMDASDIALEAIWTFVLSDPDSCFIVLLALSLMPRVAKLHLNTTLIDVLATWGQWKQEMYGKDANTSSYCRIYIYIHI